MKRKNEDLLKKLEVFDAGTKVIVSKKMARAYQIHPTKLREWFSMPCKPFEAWVVGCKWVCDGIHQSVGTYDDYQARLKVTKKTPVLRVRTSMFSKEILVPVDGVEIAELFSQYKRVRMPLNKIQQYPFTETDREVLRKEAAKMGRDEKGRWVKQDTALR